MSRLKKFSKIILYVFVLMANMILYFSIFNLYDKLGMKFMEGIYNFMNYTSSTMVGFCFISIIFIINIVLFIVLIGNTIKEPRNRKQLTFGNDEGEITISEVAIESYVKTCIKMFDQIKGYSIECKVFKKHKKEFIKVYLKCILKTQKNVSNEASYIREIIKKEVDKFVGIDVTVVDIKIEDSLARADESIFDNEINSDGEGLIDLEKKDQIENQKEVLNNEESKNEESK